MTAGPGGRPIEIVLVEDNPGDVRLTLEALKDAKVRNNIKALGDGTSAISYLKNEAPYSGGPRPDPILLDLNLPGKDGREVLQEIKAHPDLRRIPVVILTSSRAEQDIIETYDLHANAYVTKPVDLYGFLEVVKGVESFWLTVVALPP